MGKPKSKGGRPSRLTPEVKQKILNGLRGALTDAQAAALAEVDARTLRRWKAAARAKPNSEHARFVLQMRQARSAGLARLGLTVYTHAAGEKDKLGNVITPPDPKLALEVLERRDPNHWGKRHTLSGPKGGAVPIQQMNADDETQRILVEKLKKLEALTEERRA